MIIALFPILCPLLSPCRLQKEQSTEGKEDLLSDTKRNKSQEEEKDTLSAPPLSPYEVDVIM